MSWLKFWGQKALHGAVVAVGSVLPMVIMGAISPATGAKMAVGALVTYLVKPARPDSDVSLNAKPGEDPETPKAPR